MDKEMRKPVFLVIGKTGFSFFYSKFFSFLYSLNFFYHFMDSPKCFWTEYIR